MNARTRRPRKGGLLAFSIFFFFLTACSSAQIFPYRNPSLPASTRVEDLLQRMTLKEKLGQMTQVARDYLGNTPQDVADYFLGSVLSGGGSTPADNSPKGWREMVGEFQKKALSTRLGIPILYGVDAVHGHNNAAGAVVYPHHIGLGAAGDEELVREIGAQTALALKATGITWDFSPCVAVAQDLRWGRSYESFGSDPALVSRLGGAEVLGLQGKYLGETGVLATIKHFAGDGGTQGGVDRGNVVLAAQDFQKVHLAPYAAILQDDPGSVMASFSSWNGVPMHENRDLLTGWLKEKKGFAGFVVSDWGAVALLPGSPEAQVAAAVNAGVDMVMVPDKYQAFLSAAEKDVQSGEIPMARIDDAVRRILTVKFRLGLFEHPLPDENLPDKGASVFSDETQKSLARRAVEESFTLLKNEGNLLPIRVGRKIVVVGPKADDIGDLCGGWTKTWQGEEGPIDPGTTILAGLQRVFGKENVVFVPKGDVTKDAPHFRPDVVVFVAGERPYAEMMGDSSGLTPDSSDLSLWRTLQRQPWFGKIPVLTLVVSGRPLVMNEIIAESRGFAEVWLPGTEAGAVADVLAGKVKPSGRLPQPWPAAADQSRKLFAPGYGLSY